MELANLISPSMDEDTCRRTSIALPKSVSWWTAAYMCSKRSIYSYNRMPSYVIPRLLSIIIGVFVMVSVYAPQGQNDFEGLYGHVAIIFYCVMFSHPVSSVLVIDGESPP